MVTRAQRRTSHAPVNLAGVALATILAGPIFLLGLGIGTFCADPATAFPIRADASAFAMALAILPVAIIVGTIIAFLPNLVGAIVMTRLGERNHGARLPLLWALAGAFTCGVPLFASGFDGVGQPVFTIALTFTGATCGLICRRRPGARAGQRADRNRDDHRSSAFRGFPVQTATTYRQTAQTRAS